MSGARYPPAWCIARANPVMRPILMVIVLTPLLTNVVVRTIGVMILLADGGLINSSLLTSGWIGTPIQLLNTLQSLDPAVERPAANLGAGPSRTFFSVSLPAIRPGLVAASIFAFIVSFEEVTVTAFLSGGRLMTLPVRIYSESQFALEPTISAISTLLVLLSVAVLLLLARFVRHDKFWVR